MPRAIFHGLVVPYLQTRVKSYDTLTRRYFMHHPDNTKAYGFTYQEKPFMFVSMPLNKKRLAFFQQIAGGERAKLYYYYKKHQQNDRHEMFYLVKPSGENIFLKNTMTRKKMRRKMTAFFCDQQRAQYIVQAKSISIRPVEKSLQEMIELINME